MIDLVSVLEDAGIENLREGSKEISGLCPQHMDRLGKPDTHSSWSINRFTYLHHCFSCGYSGTLTGLLIDLLGTAPENLEEELAKHSFLGKLAKAQQPKAVEIPTVESPTINEWALENQMTDVPQRLVDFRLLQRKAVDAYGIRWDVERKAWVLPIRSDTGTLLGAQFRQKGVELNLPEGLEKSVTLFGLKEMQMYSTVALVESPLDAVRMFGIGIPAVSSFGAWVSWDQCRLLARNFTSVVMTLDNDKTGRATTVVASRMLKKRGAMTIPFDYTGLVDKRGEPAKDPGDVASDTDLWQAWKRSLRLGL